MRIVFIGVSHWHVPFYLDPCLDLPNVTVVGVSDDDITRAEPIAAQAGCQAFADHREMCATLRPDFAFALGRHCDMPVLGRFLINACIPFAMEKPCGTTLAEVRALATLARAADAFVAIPFVFRHCALLDAVREAAAGEAIHTMSFKFVGGLVDRYREAGCGWMLDRATAGGGPLINLGVHFLDLCRVLLPGAAFEVTAAMISNGQARLSIEDHAVVLLQGGGARCMVETGYLYPAPHSVFDMHYSIRTARHYFAVRDAHTLEISNDDRTRQVRGMDLINAPLYPTFVADTLRRLEHGEKPIAGLDDMVEAMRLVQDAYTLSPLA
jgi:predicted dehydrogenase